MGDKVRNMAQAIERGKYGLIAGRKQGLLGPSLDDAGDGRPWTYHDPSPMVGPEVWRAIRMAARVRPSAASWVERVAELDRELARWLIELPPGEAEMAWVEIRG